MGFDPKTETPHLSGKVILVTGGTGGLGAQSVIKLAQWNPSTIYLTGRNAKGAEATITEAAAASDSATSVRFLECDLDSLASVKSAANRVLAEQSRLDILIANAGVMNHPPALTKDGYEYQFGVNYLSHALLIKLLMPLLESTAARTEADVRIVQLTSTGFRGAPSGGIQFDSLKTVQKFAVFGGFVRYGQSKLADLLLASELAKRYPQFTSVSVTPGIVGTDLVKRQSGFHRAHICLAAKVGGQGGLIKPEDAAWSTLWCVGAPRDEIKNGAFYEPVGVLSKVETKFTKDAELSRKLWEWTEKELEKW
ncbi:oxidoreductase [Podospora didyma]|uniref:Oxidoreductase n=1 Tax=Podospora didyma TaxID=330526 RepID=A0AAE0NUN0_9PEZI|nr:oxidoreductase [Podospora didyma]